MRLTRRLAMGLATVAATVVLSPNLKAQDVEFAGTATSCFYAVSAAACTPSTNPGRDPHQPAVLHGAVVDGLTRHVVKRRCDLCSSGEIGSMTLPGSAIPDGGGLGENFLLSLAFSRFRPTRGRGFRPAYSSADHGRD